MRRHPEGAEATVIGMVVADHPGLFVGTTSLGANRVIDTQIGERLPRIC